MNSGISTGTADIQRAEEIAMEWFVNGRPEKESVGGQSVVDLMKKTNITAKDAESICKELKRRGFISTYVMKGSRQEVKAKDYFLDFYSVSNKSRLADGKTITKGYAKQETTLVKKYWLPFIGEKMLSEITADDLREFKIELQNQEFADSHKRSIFNAGLMALKQAQYERLIDADITAGIKNFKGKAKEKAILTPEQADALFKSKWKSAKIMLGNYLAYRTGFRVGEVIGLQKEDLRMIDNKYFIQLRHSYSRYDGLKGTKTNSNELIPIQWDLMSLLLHLANENPYNNGFVFWSDKGKRTDKPICASQMLHGLKDQLKVCGFADSARRITFHSWRHFNRTYMQVVGKVSSRTLSKVTGHSVPMIDNLYSNHWTEEDCVEYEEGEKRLYKPVSEYFAVPVEYDCSEPLLLEG